MSSCMHMCMYIYACECVCALAMLWLLLRCVCYLFSIKTPHFPSRSSQWECVHFFFFPAEVRNRTLASMWFELGPLKLWRTPRMTWGTCRPKFHSVERRRELSGILWDFLARAPSAIKTGRKLKTQWIVVMSHEISLVCHTLMQTQINWSRENKIALLVSTI